MNMDINTILYTTLIGAIIMAIYLYMEARRKPKKPEYKTIEILECTKCGYKIEKEYEPGDFIGMIKGKCPKCNSPMKIKAIYAVEKTPSKT
ncbi:hypothetical protein Smar_0894 [Staphylothermus marinus F1]|uniref:Uncharacterized protein n=1 Tax=Staphylothermus marinus (strain ATCC 43588 / DSM 3639 / JCM 9404 / F1) TaxID=399550 RepID=A3DMY4_STAMF|nr:hypothetical protein [Staphylothermus marinus]ABN69994.1 hypothetical protein Smar_0894 [Staphylothermus marinus F1]